MTLRQICIAFALLIVPCASAAQVSVDIRIRDASTSEGIFGATVVVDSSGRLMVSDRGGLVHLKLAKGEHVIAVVALGMNPYKTRLQISAAPIKLDVDLQPNPIALEEVTATASSASFLGRVGFTERQRAGHGWYLFGKELATISARSSRLSDALLTAPGIIVLPTRVGLGYVAVSSRGPNSIRFGCRSAIYLDGMPMKDLDDINQIASLDQIGAIEVYGGVVGAPLQYESGCGTIMLWTNR